MPLKIIDDNKHTVKFQDDDKNDIELLFAKDLGEVSAVLMSAHVKDDHAEAKTSIFFDISTARDIAKLILERTERRDTPKRRKNDV